METIIKYLKNPMDVGVYNHIYMIDFSGVSGYLEALLVKFKDAGEEQKPPNLPKRFVEERASRLNEALEDFKQERRDDRDFFSGLTGMLGLFCLYSKDCPETMVKTFTRERKIGDRVVRLRLFGTDDIFESHLLPENNDVILIDKKNISKKKWMFDIISTKEKAILSFKEMLEAIPTVKENMEVKKSKQHFSMRYVFRPYPWVVQLWLKSESSITVPFDLKSFLNGAVRYILSSEWRTSIVLSAISIESVLADIYEETHKEPAPDVPLGDLFKQVRSKVDFPQDIIKAVTMANDARIAAVHRSRSSVSDREANNALFGATNFVYWYYSQS
jgi:hypothetical protein